MSRQTCCLKMLQVGCFPSKTLLQNRKKNQFFKEIIIIMTKRSFPQGDWLKSRQDKLTRENLTSLQFKLLHCSSTSTTSCLICADNHAYYLKHSHTMKHDRKAFSQNYMMAQVNPKALGQLAWRKPVLVYSNINSIYFDNIIKSVN